MQHLTIARTWNGISLKTKEEVELTLEAMGDDLRVVVDAPYYDDPPPPGPPGPCPELWNYEVVELFVVGEGPSGPRYTEVELSPHGHFLLLRLSGIRQVVEQGRLLSYTVSVDPPSAALPRWRGEALVPREFLPPPPHRLNAFAMHGLGPSRRYLAMVPVPGSGPEDTGPDFHRLEHFLPWVLP